MYLIRLMVRFVICFVMYKYILEDLRNEQGEIAHCNSCRISHAHYLFRPEVNPDSFEFLLESLLK